MAATQRRTLSISQPLHIKQEPLSLRPHASSPPQQHVGSDGARPISLLEQKTPKAPTIQQANGYHSDAAETSGLCTTLLGGKAARIQQIVEEAASPESRRSVELILSQVQQLTTAEKLLLYLKLPGGRNGTGNSGADPLRQPMNPLGTRFEIQQTITWIKTHLTEDPDISLPKQDVYDEYLAYCSSNQMKPLSTADFGKVMKQVFPRVRPRRLGTRGNSRYCYAGLCKRMRLEAPLLPDLGADVEPHNTPTSQIEDNLEAAASFLIREWAQKLLGQQFCSLRSLACHLVDKMCVDGRSVAAFALLSSTSEPRSKHTSPSTSSSQSAQGSNNRARETTAPLQRKDKEPAREHKRKEQDKTSEGPSPRPTSGCKRPRLKNGRSSVESPVCRSEPKKRQTPPATIVAAPTQSPTPSIPSTSTPSPMPIAKLPIPRLNTATSNKVGTNYILISPPQPKAGQRKKYKLIQPKPDPPSNGSEEARFFTEPAPAASVDCVAPVSSSSLEKDTLDDYLHGGNSQEQEEELMLYFQQSTASPPAPVTAAANVAPPEEPAKISQLRLLLERNLTKDTANTQSTRRRVSFETSTLDPVPPSPNTRRNIFSFTPISPDAAPGNGGHPPPPSPAAPPRSSVPSSASASPFVSPRNTPVPRSRHNSGQQFIFPPGPSRTRHCSSGGVSQRGATQLTRPRHFSGTSVARTYTAVPNMYDDAQFAEPSSAPHSPMIAPSSLADLSVHTLPRHRHVSAGPQLHMQIPVTAVDPLAQEVSALLSEPLPAMPQFRSQSVPLHQMAGRFAGPLCSGSNSITATPVPSEFADFLESEPFDSIACEQLNQLFMDSEDVMLEPARNFSSRSYPNTPVAELGGPALGGLNIPEASSRSYPSTPVEPDPLMAHLTLNAINHSLTQGGAVMSTLGARRNLADLLDQTPSFSVEQATYSTDQVGFVAAGGETSAFVAAPEQPSFLMDDFDQSELSQLVQEVEGSSQLSQEGTLE